MMAGYTVYGALQTINLLRYPDVLDWTRFSALFYTFFVMTLFLTGAYGTWKAQQQK
jgi:NADPH:quinone reductase-like Zn-dependent oxidoreductase